MGNWTQPPTLPQMPDFKAPDARLQYENFWANVSNDAFADPETLNTLLRVMSLGINTFGESVMPSFGWGTKNYIIGQRDHRDAASMNMVKAVQAALGVTVDGKYGTDTQQALQLFGFKGLRVGAQITNVLARRLEQIMNSDFIWPVRNPIVTSAFGYRRAPKTSGGKGSSNHPGIDMGGDPSIAASADGTVVDAGFDNLNGWHVTIDHGNGRKTSYVHLKSRPSVKIGQDVNQGQLVGTMGDTGNSGGVHLHFGYKVNGMPVDPMTILPYDPNMARQYPVVYDSNLGTYVNRY